MYSILDSRLLATLVRLEANQMWEYIEAQAGADPKLFDNHIANDLIEWYDRDAETNFLCTEKCGVYWGKVLSDLRHLEAICISLTVSRLMRKIIRGLNEDCHFIVAD